jgi:anti-anti-sigma factor
MPASRTRREVGFIMHNVTGLVEAFLAADNAALVLRLRGDLDRPAAAQAGTDLRVATAALPPPGLVVVDLTAVQFFSAAAVHALEGFAADCADRGIGVRLVTEAGSIVHRILELIEFSPHVPVFTSLDQAVAARSRYPCRGSSEDGGS